MNKVLFVEDSIAILDYFQELMGLFPDLECLTARDLPKVLEVLPENKQEVIAVFCDGKLVNSFGWDVAQMLKDLGFSCPMFYIGNYSLPIEKADLFELCFQKHETETFERIIKKCKTGDIQ